MKELSREKSFQGQLQVETQVEKDGLLNDGLLSFFTFFTFILFAISSESISFSLVSMA